MWQHVSRADAGISPPDIHKSKAKAIPASQMHQGFVMQRSSVTCGTPLLKPCLIHKCMMLPVKVGKAGAINALLRACTGQ